MPQSFDKILLHVVFSTKGRKTFLKERSLREKTHAYIAGICRNMESPAEIVGGTEDHVHVLLSLARKHAVAGVLREIKSHSTLWIKKKSGIKGFAWQRGYSAFSVSASKADEVRNYIAKQENHHRKISFKDELRKLLKRHGIEFDEKYMWD